MRPALMKYAAKLLVFIAPLVLLLAPPALAQEAEWRRMNQELTALHAQGKYAEAAAVARRALRLAETAFAPEHPALATSLNNVAMIDAALGRYAEAEPLYRRALAIYEKSLGAEHPEVGLALSNLAWLHATRGRHAEAERLYKRSLAIYEKARGPDDPDVALTLNNLAALDDTLGRYAQAEGLFRRALAIFEKARGPQHPDVALGLANLGAVLRTQGRFAEAEPLLLRALAIFEKSFGPDHPDVALSLNNLATLYDVQGRYDLAEARYKRALAIYERAFGTDHDNVATALGNLARLYELQGQYAQAEPLARRTLTIVEKAFGADHPRVAFSLNNLAALYGTQERYAESEPLLRRALAIYEKTLGADHPEITPCLLNLADAYVHLKRHAQAEPFLLRALAIREKVMGADHPDVAQSLRHLAMLHYARGQFEPGEALVQRALKITEKALGPEHPEVAKGLNDLAWFHIERKRWHEALDALRKSTRILARRALAAAETAASQRTTARAGGADTFASHAIVIGRILPAEADRRPLVAEAFAVSQYVSMADTGAALAQMAARASAGNDVLARRVREHQDAVAAWRQFDRQLNDALGKPAAQRDAANERALRRQLADTDARMARLNAELQRDFPEYRELVSPEPLTVVEAEKLLRPDEALLTYLITENESLLWVIRSGHAEMIRLESGREKLEKLVARLRRGVDLSAGVLPRFPHADALTLYREVLAPAMAHLAGVRHLIVVANGPLQSVPFGMLLSAELAPDADPPWLIRQFAFTNLPAATSLRALRRFARESKADEAFVGFGDPLLKGTPEEARGVSTARLFARGALADTREVGRMARLPETADELQAIARTLKAPAHAVLLREAATERQVKSMDLRRYRVLAFSTHGLLSGDFKGLAEPALVLTPPATASEIDDGLLTASEVAALKLDADWVILSACNTAAADGKPGAEGFSGLAKAFFYAGSRTLLVSHWAVASEATVTLTTQMLAAAEKGAGPAAALRQSMLAMADHPTDRRLRHPAFWAPFVVVGEGMTARQRSAPR